MSCLVCIGWLAVVCVEQCDIEKERHVVSRRAVVLIYGAKQYG